MRVITGVAGGLTLFVPRSELRPTMDKVRGAIFDSLREVVIGARVLDLFAGSGALGIEALSRGAASVVFVENDRRAVAAIERNLVHTRLTGTVHPGDIFSYLDRLAGPAAFDLVFADPPYVRKPGDRDFDHELLQNAALQHTLAPDGIFILEHLPGAKLPLGTGWECLRQKRYGATEVAMLRRK